MTIPDFETTLLDRLALCNTDILGAGHVWRLPPTYAKDVGEYPMVYAEPKGMREPIPNRSRSGGEVVVNRDYLISVFIAPTAPMDELQQRKGAVALDKASTYLATFRDYYVNLHADLSTATLPGLGLAQALQYSETGLVPNLIGPGGTQWTGFVITLTLAMRGELDVNFG